MSWTFLWRISVFIFQPNKSFAGLSEDHKSAFAQKVRGTTCRSRTFCSSLLNSCSYCSLHHPIAWGHLGLFVICWNEYVGRWKMFKFKRTKLGAVISDKLYGDSMSSQNRFKSVDNTTGWGTAEFQNLQITGKVVDDNQVLSFSLNRPTDTFCQVYLVVVR